MTIRWKPIPSWPEYEISTRGQIRRVGIGRGAKVGRVLKPGELKPFGHHYVVLSARGKQKTRLVSRLVLLTFVGPPPKGKTDAAHRDGNARNDYVKNLRWSTRAQNEGDKVRHGRTNRGERHGLHKLTEAEVFCIRAMKGKTQDHIAKLFKVSRRHVSDILNRVCWKHI